MAKPAAVDRTTVVAISNKKLTPTTPKMRNAPALGNCSLTPLSKKGRKNNKQKMIKMPVLITGTKKLDVNNAATLLFFLRALNMSPVTRPATVHFNKHAKTVPIGLIGIKMAKVEGENKAITPLKKPTTAPDRGPQIAAAKTIVIKERLILTGPNCK